MKKKRKLWKKIVITILVLLILLGAGAGILWKAVDPYRGTTKEYVESLGLDEVITGQQAREDMDFVMKMMRSRHPAWLEEDNTKAASVEKKYEEELVKVGEEMTVAEEWAAIGRIMHELGDGHTNIYNCHRDAGYIDDFTQAFAGYEIVAVNDVPVEEIYSNFLSIYQYELEDYARSVFYANILYSEDYLTWCGVDTSQGVSFTYDTGSGLQTYHYDFVPIDQAKGRENSADGQHWVSYEIDEENQTGIFTLKSCDYNKEYKETVKNFFKEVEDRQIENVIVDLRWNGGGSSLVGDEFLKYLDVDGYYGWASEIRYGNYLFHSKRAYVKNRKKQPLFDGKVYVLTNLHTYSSAMDFAMLIGDNDLGELVGEASGNLPSAYGDVLRFTTPHSKLSFLVSYKRWHRIDPSREGEPLTPDYPCRSEEALKKAMELIGGLVIF